jgi:hypothetical protein
MTSSVNPYRAYLDAPINLTPAQDLLRLEGDTPCVDGPQNLMSTLCAPGAR